MSSQDITEFPELAEHVKTIYAVDISDSDVSHYTVYFEDENKAVIWCAANHGVGWYGGPPGKPYKAKRVVINGVVLMAPKATYYKDVVDEKAKTVEQLRKDAFARLTPAERAALGLTDV